MIKRHRKCHNITGIGIGDIANFFNHQIRFNNIDISIGRLAAISEINRCDIADGIAGCVCRNIGDNTGNANNDLIGPNLRGIIGINIECAEI